MRPRLGDDARRDRRILPSRDHRDADRAAYVAGFAGRSRSCLQQYAVRAAWPGPHLVDDKGFSWNADYLNEGGHVVRDSRADIAAEAGALNTYEALLKLTDDEGTRRALNELATREVSHTHMFMEALNSVNGNPRSSTLPTRCSAKSSSMAARRRESNEMLTGQQLSGQPRSTAAQMGPQSGRSAPASGQGSPQNGRR